VDGVSDLANVKLCCDVNHYLSDKAETAIEVLGERIKTLHISDHDYIDERHVLPKDGKIDWMALIGALEKTDYQGVFNYEITRSLNEYVFYTLADIKRNYEELFEEYNRMK
jgi:sugar phosphate isomerase/epimerase